MPGVDPATTLIVARLRAAGCVFAEDEAALLIAEAGSPAELDDMVAQRVAGLPLEHVLGWAEFCGLRIAVDHGVFVPRPRTEFLAGQAVALTRPGAVVVDLCCGSGAIGVVVVTSVARVELHAADIDPAAARCAARNVVPLGGRVHEGDLFEPLPPDLRGRIDVLAVNTPYVPTADLATMPQEAREHEPRLALDGGADGLDLQRRVAALAPEWLAPGGSVLVEATARQAPVTLEAFTRNRLTSRTCRDDELDATVVVGTLRER